MNVAVIVAGIVVIVGSLLCGVWLLHQPRQEQAPLPKPLSPAQRLTIRSDNSQPQSDREVRELVERLRVVVNDPLLDIRWDAKNVLLKKGVYTETGKLIPPEYEGRWQVVRHKTESIRRPEHERETVVICTLSAPVRDDHGTLQMIYGGAYAPLGEWVLELMKSADSAQVRQFEQLRERLWKQHDEMEEKRGRLDEGMAREGLDRVHFKGNFAGGVGNWQGKGADFKEMEKTAANRRAVVTP